MLVAIAKKDNVKKVAKYTTKEDGPFVCPNCGEEVILKKGKEIANFFSHKNATNCVYGIREKEIQRRAKMELYDTLSQKGYRVELEHVLQHTPYKAYIIDVLAVLPQGTIGIMFGGNTLTPAEVRCHIKDCHEAGIVLFWGSFVKGTDIKSRYLPTGFEKFIHNYQKGTIYYWAGGDTFKACHYAPYTPKSKTIERNYGKYVLRMMDEKKRALDSLVVQRSTHKLLSGTPYPCLAESVNEPISTL